MSWDIACPERGEGEFFVCTCFQFCAKHVDDRLQRVTKPRDA